MSETIPKFHETFIPMLKILESGEELHYEELKKRVRDKFYSHLPSELLTQKTSTGNVLILNRIGWAKSYLKEGKFLEYPRRAYVKITAKGLTALKNGHLTLKELKKDEDYIATQKAKQKNKKISDEDASEKDYSPQDLIDEGFDTIKANVKLELLERLKEIEPFYFEKVILILLKKMGYGEFIETKKTGDGGIDGIINQDQLGISKIYIQAKRYTENKVREKDIRNFIGAMSGDTTNGVFVTTSTFDDGAIEKAKQAHHKIILIDGFRLTDLMFEFGVGVQTTNIYEMKKVDEDFFENDE
jgi:restriction system protein